MRPGVGAAPSCAVGWRPPKLPAMRERIRRRFGIVLLGAWLGACGGSGAVRTEAATAGASTAAAQARVQAPPPKPADGRALIAPSWRWLVELDQAPVTVAALTPYVDAFREVWGEERGVAVDTALGVAKHAERVSLFASDATWVAALAGVSTLASLGAALEAVTSEPTAPWPYRRLDGVRSGRETGVWFEGGMAVAGAEAEVRAAVDAAYAAEGAWQMPVPVLRELYDAHGAHPARAVGLLSDAERSMAATSLRALDIRISEACRRLEALGLGLSVNAQAGRLRLSSQLVFATAKDATTVHERVRRLTRRTSVKISARLMGLGFLLSRLHIEARDKRVVIRHEMSPGELRRLLSVVQGLRQAG